MFAVFGTTSHMVTTEKNMPNIWYAETIVILGDCLMLTGTKFGYWNGYQKLDGRIYGMYLSYMDVISGLHATVLRMAQLL